jgi:NAD(P)-dependent dehydrogenase (short-subunit alcohol dehydrogenase family)
MLSSIATEEKNIMSETIPLFNRLFSLAGKSVLITGASSGIGATLAVAYAQAGAQVGVHGRDHARVEQTCREVEAVGGKAVPLYADLEDVQACCDLIAETHEKLGRLDILINNAGINRRKPISAVTEDDYESITGTNIRAVFFLSQAAHPLMKKQSGGKILHIASLSVFYALDTVSVYGLSKGAVAQLTKVQAIEWAADNIQVNCITPGFVRTPLTKPVWDDPQKANWLLTRIPARRAAEPDDLIGAALLMTTPSGNYITGQNIIIDGGFLAGGSWAQDNL